MTFHFLSASASRTLFLCSFAAPPGPGREPQHLVPTTTAPRARAPAGGKADATPLTNSPSHPWLAHAPSRFGANLIKVTEKETAATIRPTS